MHMHLFHVGLGTHAHATAPCTFDNCTRSGSPHNVLHSSSIIYSIRTSSFARSATSCGRRATFCCYVRLSAATVTAPRLHRSALLLPVSRLRPLQLLLQLLLAAFASASAAAPLIASASAVVSEPDSQPKGGESGTVAYRSHIYARACMSIPKCQLKVIQWLSRRC